MPMPIAYYHWYSEGPPRRRRPPWLRHTELAAGSELLVAHVCAAFGQRAERHGQDCVVQLSILTMPHHAAA